MGSEGQRRAGRPCGPSLGRWAPQHCSPRSGAPSQGCPRSAPGPWDGVQRAPHMSAAAQLPALQTHQRHNWGGRFCTASPWKELTRVPGRRPRRTARGSPYTPLSEKPAQAKGVMQRAFKILHKNTAAFQKLPPSHPGYPLARSGLWRCLCGEVWFLPAVMTQMPLDLCLSREYHLKVSLIFFFFKEYDQWGKKRRNNHGEVSCPENKVCKCLFKASHVASEGYLVAGEKKNPKAFPVKRLILLQPLWVSPSFESAQQEETAVSDHRLHWCSQSSR